MRGVPWVAVPTTLVGQVDAAIGGKTAVDLAGGKNLIGAFHRPERVVVDPVLATLPEREQRNGMAEAVKTGLLMGRPVWDLLEVRAGCAAFKSAVSSRIRRIAGRAILNLGHTFGHALEAAAGYELAHGEAVALGMVAALRLSGHDAAPGVEELLARGRLGLTGRWPGRRSDGTKRRAAGRLASCCSSATANRRGATSVRPLKSGPRSTSSSSISRGSPGG